MTINPTPQPEADLREKVKSALFNYKWGKSSINDTADAILALICSPAEGGAVAWRFRSRDGYGTWSYCPERPDYLNPATYLVEPLFTRPAPIEPGVREKVEAALRGVLEWDEARGYRMPYRTRDPIYAALDALIRPTTELSGNTGEVK